MALSLLPASMRLNPTVACMGLASQLSASPSGLTICDVVSFPAPQTDPWALELSAPASLCQPWGQLPRLSQGGLGHGELQPLPSPLRTLGSIVAREGAVGRSSTASHCLSPGPTEEPQGLCVLSPLPPPSPLPLHNHGIQMSGIRLKMPKAHDAVGADPHGKRPAQGTVPAPTWAAQTNLRGGTNIGKQTDLF